MSFAKRIIKYISRDRGVVLLSRIVRKRKCNHYQVYYCLVAVIFLMLAARGLE